MELTNDSKIAVIGGGPAGAFAAYFLLDFARRIGLEGIEVDIFEPKEFDCAGAKGCNHCGGLISESMLQNLSMEGILIPSDVIMNSVDSYRLHTRDGQVHIHLPLVQMRIATVYRGGGPKPEGKGEQPELPKISFDGYLLDLAIAKGARHVPERVMKLSWEADRPRVETKNGTARAYDLLIGAVGVNGGGMKLFEDWNFGYAPPETVKAYVSEFHLGCDNVQRYVGSAMNVFLLDIPGLKFAAIIPKGPYVTLCIQGEITDELVNAFLDDPAVRRCFPPGWEPPRGMCHCLPKCNIGEPERFFTDRVALVGDCGVSRLYKDGIGAAYLTARACAATAVFFGMGAEDFRKHYLPICNRLKRDNQLGHMVFDMIALPKKLTFLRHGILSMTRREQALAGPRRPMSIFLWNSFTGSATYRRILLEAAHPRFTLRFLWEILKALLPRRRRVAA
ncbi:MAG: hypothetical protein HQM03_05095 [Magnetococcales bacterium]|nr:hypothetical protein [Magnetococcales bacterium]